MELKSMFSPGDTVWCVDRGVGVIALTVGKVTVIYTDSPGMADTLFDNYKPQKSYKEEYQCVETGIGTGGVYTLGVNIFKNKAEAESKLAELTL